MVDGRMQRVKQRVQRIRWQRVYGTTNAVFDDELTHATHTISRVILDKLAPWNFTQLTPYNEKFLLGFVSEEYNIAVDEGFEQVKLNIDAKIDRDIRLNIGGDRQRIHQKNTQYTNIHYKSILLPIYKASYTYQNKTYHLAVNAQNAKVAGEKPKSGFKIGVAVVFGLLLLAVVLYVANNPSRF